MVELCQCSRWIGNANGMGSKHSVYQSSKGKVTSGTEAVTEP